MVIPNEEMKDIMNIVKLPEESCLLTKIVSGTTKIEANV